MKKNKDIEYPRPADRPWSLLSATVDRIDNSSSDSVDQRDSDWDARLEPLVVCGRINGEGTCPCIVAKRENWRVWRWHTEAKKIPRKRDVDAWARHPTRIIVDAVVKEVSLESRQK